MSANNFWESCLADLQQNLPSQQFNTWIRPLCLESEAQGDVSIAVPNGFSLDWVRKNYLRHIEEFARDFFGTPVKVSLCVAKENQVSGGDLGKSRQADVLQEAPLELPASPVAGGSPGREGKAGGKKGLKFSAEPSRAYEQTRLRPDLVFDNLVVGKANDLARAAAQQVACNPGTAYNPLFVYGSTGLGKTHLIHAIGNHIVSQCPEKIVRYVHAEDYYSSVVTAYQQKSFDALKRYYRSLDILLLDDVQFFNGKNRSQDEFFFVFNALLEAKKQMVITCDTYPKNINGLDDRLVTRFDWGLTVQIEPPETEMRVAILKKKAEAEGLALSDEVAFFIARHLRSNVRELEGALNKVLAYSNFMCVEVTLETVKEALKDIIRSVRNINIDGIQKTVADYYKIKVGDLFSKKRTRAIARPRQIAMWLCKEITPNSYPMIGEAFGGRDHTTVMHAVRTIENLRTQDNELSHDLHVLTQVLKGA